MQRIMETFKQVNGYSGYYIGNGGTLLSGKTGELVEMKTTKYPNEPSYYYILNCNNKRRKIRVGMLVSGHFQHNPDPEVLNTVYHIDRDYSNNDIDNLINCTKSYSNKCEKLLHNLSQTAGENNRNSKLSNTDVLDIYNSIELSSVDMAKRYDIDKSLVVKIRNGTLWNHVTHHKLDEIMFSV